jgi:hypothetical protein
LRDLHDGCTEWVWRLGGGSKLWLGSVMQLWRMAVWECEGEDKAIRKGRQRRTFWRRSGRLFCEEDGEIVGKIMCRGEWRGRRKVFEFCIFGQKGLSVGERQTMLWWGKLRDRDRSEGELETGRDFEKDRRKEESK